MTASASAGMRDVSPLLSSREAVSNAVIAQAGALNANTMPEEIFNAVRQRKNPDPRLHLKRNMIGQLTKQIYEKQCIECKCLFLTAQSNKQICSKKCRSKRNHRSSKRWVKANRGHVNKMAAKWRKLNPGKYRRPYHYIPRPAHYCCDCKAPILLGRKTNPTCGFQMIKGWSILRCNQCVSNLSAEESPRRKTNERIIFHPVTHSSIPDRFEEYHFARLTNKEIKIFLLWFAGFTDVEINDYLFRGKFSHARIHQFRYKIAGNMRQSEKDFNSPFLLK